MRNIVCLNICIFWNILLVRGQTFTSIINTASGPIRGLISTTIEDIEYAAFKGIPYAEPPVGYFRFKPPVAIDVWTNVYDATTEGNICTQVSLNGKFVLGSEDCLYINVYTPHTDFNGSILKPVMVWIYGGSYVFGESRQSMYGPDFILGEDVIFVSFNYRLSALGFLNLEHENATGNCALKDQNLALKWVKRNIAEFGGNPDKITIFGHSAGSVSVDLHVLSDMSVGLFSQSISISGSTLCLYWGFQRGAEAVVNGFVLGSTLGTYTLDKDVLLRTLYNASAADIVMAVDSMVPISFRPSIEKSDIATYQEKFLTECTLIKYLTGNYTKGAHMLGFTSDETMLLFARRDDLLTVTELALESLVKASRHTPLLSHLRKVVVTTKIMNNDITYEFIKRTTDLFFVLGIDTKLRFISRNNNYPIYYYRFSFQSNYSLHKAVGINLEGAAHADDLPYIFFMPLAKLPLYQLDIATTRQRMVKLYTNFAKYGNPTPSGDDDEILGLTWPDSRSNGVHLEIGKNLTIGRRPTNYLVKLLQLLGLGSSPYLNDCNSKHILDAVKSKFDRHNGISGSIWL